MEEFTSKELHEKCGNYLDIKVTDAEKYTMLLEKQFQHNNYSVLKDNIVRVFNINQAVENYSALASDNSIGIQAMNIQHNSLEEYYMSLIKEGKNND